MKTRKLIVALSALLGLSTFALVACDGAQPAPVGDTPTPVEHTHVFGEDWESDGTSHWHECSAGDCTEKSGKTEHVFGTATPGDPATCYEKGTETFVCNVCDYTKTVDTDMADHFPALVWSHDETSHWHECTNDGCSAHLGKVDHDWEEDLTVDALATCTKDGSKSVHCSTCDATKDTTVVPASHDWGEWTEKMTSTCVDAQVLQRECKVDGCDGHEEKNGAAALGHDWEEDLTVDTPATCETDGSKSVHCSTCDATKDTTVVPASHDWGEWTEKTASTCVDAQVLQRACKVDGCDVHEEKNGAAALGHDWEEDLTVDALATCTKDGSKSVHCYVCDATKDVTVLPSTGHTPTGVYCKCAVCGTQPGTFDGRMQGNNSTLTFTVKAGAWYTANHFFMSAGYIVYTYEGETPIRVWYSTYGNGAVQKGDGVTLNNGDSFFMPASARGTGYLAINGKADADVSGKINAVWQSAAPVMPKALVPGEQNVTAAIDSDDPNTFYEFVATEDGENNYVLYCDDVDAVVYKKDASDSEYVEISELPYSFTLAKGEKISFQMLVAFESTKKSYQVNLVMGEAHSHAWGEWSQKSAATCLDPTVLQRDCTDENCPVNGHQEKYDGEALGHTLVHTPKADATCTEIGHEEYWQCSVCKNLYSDENCEHRIGAAVAILASGHAYGDLIVDDENKTVGSVCTVCGAPNETNRSFDSHAVAALSAEETCLVGEGSNLVQVNRGETTGETIMHRISFTADQAGTYVFDFTLLTENKLRYRTCQVTDADGNKVAVTPKRVLDGVNIKSITVELEAGATVSFQLMGQLPAAETVTYYIVAVSSVENA